MLQGILGAFYPSWAVIIQDQGFFCGRVLRPAWSVECVYLISGRQAGRQAGGQTDGRNTQRIFSFASCFGGPEAVWISLGDARSTIGVRLHGEVKECVLGGLKFCWLVL